MRQFLDFEKPVAELEAKIEELRGKDARPSRAYSYRSGYALPSAIPIGEIRQRIEQAERAVEERKKAKTDEN